MGSVRKAVVVVLGGLLAGCSSGGDDEGGVSNYMGGPVAERDLPAVVGGLFCQALEPCCAEAGMAISRSSCETLLSLGLRSELAAADPSKYSYDGEVAGRCLEELQAQSGGACDGGDADLMGGTVCAEAFEGTVPPGGACASSVECQRPESGEVDCDQPSDGAPGTCVSEPTASEGEPCYWTCTVDGNSRTCYSLDPGDGPEQARCFTNDGLYCNLDGICAAQSGAGESCDGSESCGAGLFCDRDSVCQPELVEGEACDFWSECQEGFFCNDDACAPQLPVGAACDDLSDECLDGYCDAGTCVQGGDLGDLGASLFCGLLSGG